MKVFLFFVMALMCAGMCSIEAASEGSATKPTGAYRQNSRNTANVTKVGGQQQKETRKATVSQSYNQDEDAINDANDVYDDQEEQSVRSYNSSPTKEKSKHSRVQNRSKPKPDSIDHREKVGLSFIQHPSVGNLAGLTLSSERHDLSLLFGMSSVSGSGLSESSYAVGGMLLFKGQKSNLNPIDPQFVYGGGYFFSSTSAGSLAITQCAALSAVGYRVAFGNATMTATIFPIQWQSMSVASSTITGLSIFNSGAIVFSWFL